MENWRGLFRERFVIEENTEEKYLRKYDHRTIVEELEHFIEQELDKARVEGKEDVLKQLEKLAHYGAEHFKDDEHSQFLNLCNGIYHFQRWGKLSKLKTKEEEKEIYKCVKCGRVVEDKRLLTFSGVCTRCAVVI